MSDTEFTWVNVTTWALRDWEAALRRYADDLVDFRLYSPDADQRQLNLALARLDNARRNYRQRVLSWFWKLCAPIVLDGTQEVPNEVAELLAEDWDLNTTMIQKLDDARRKVSA